MHQAGLSGPRTFLFFLFSFLMNMWDKAKVFYKIKGDQKANLQGIGLFDRKTCCWWKGNMLKAQIYFLINADCWRLALPELTFSSSFISQLSAWMLSEMLWFLFNCASDWFTPGNGFLGEVNYKAMWYVRFPGVIVPLKIHFLVPFQDLFPV